MKEKPKLYDTSLMGVKEFIKEEIVKKSFEKIHPSSIKFDRIDNELTFSIQYLKENDQNLEDTSVHLLLTHLSEEYSSIFKRFEIIPTSFKSKKIVELYVYMEGAKMVKEKEHFIPALVKPMQYFTIDKTIEANEKLWLPFAITEDYSIESEEKEKITELVVFSSGYRKNDFLLTSKHNYEILNKHFINALSAFSKYTSSSVKHLDIEDKIRLPYSLQHKTYNLKAENQPYVKVTKI